MSALQIGSVCSSLCHWMEGFQKDFMPVICSRLVDKLADLEHDQLFSLLTAIPPDLPCKEDFCNKAGEVGFLLSAVFTVSSLPGWVFIGIL